MSRTATAPTPAPAVDLIASIIRSSAPLPGAACRGRPELFDPAGDREPVDEVEARHCLALNLCRQCPELRDCRQWFDRLTPGDRPRGVIAGLVNDPQPKRKKENAA